MLKKSRICTFYFFVLLFIGAIVTHNETIGTAIRLVMWFIIPMSLTFFLEIFGLGVKTPLSCL
jgi:hypothetical protein